MTRSTHHSLLLALCAFALAAPTGCTRGDGVMASNVRPVSTFSYVSIREAAYVQVRQGPELSVEVSGDSNLIGAVSTYVTNETLFVSSKDNLQPQLPITVYLTMPKVDGFKTGPALGVTFEDVALERLELTVEGEGPVEITGSIGELELEVTAPGIVDAVDATIEKARVKVDDVAVVDLNVTDTLDVTAAAGVVRYVKRPPNITKQLMGEAAVGRVDLDERAAEKARRAAGADAAPGEPPKSKSQKNQDAIDKAMGY